MYLTIKLLLTSLVATFTINMVHDLHLSKTQIRHKTESNSIQISMHVFTDDLDDAIRLTYDHKLSLLTSKEAVNADSIILEYIDSKFKITLDDTPQKLNFIGKESSEDLLAVWCYLEIKNVDKYQKIQIENKLLHELFEDQKNIISYLVDDKNQKFEILDKKDIFMTVE